MTKRTRDDLPGDAGVEHLNTVGGEATKKRRVAKAKVDPHVSGAVNETRPSKVERRKLKKLRKLGEEMEQDDIVNGEEDASKLPHAHDPAKVAAKAARRAEKAQLKDKQDQSASGVDKEKSKDEGLSAEAKSKRRTERKLAKEQKNALQQPEKDGVVATQAEAVIQNAKNDAKVVESSDRSITGYTEDPDLTSLADTEIQSFLSSNFITVKDPTSQNPLRPITKFSYLPRASQATPLATFKAPTPIQASTWPFLLSGRDVVGVAETGSGKTLAFGIPCIRSVSSIPTSKKSQIPARAVIISPTRELAVQIHTQIEALCTAANKIQSACVYGGVPKDPQRLALSTAHIVVATPGRLLDLIEEGAANLAGVKYLVLDEADRMLEKGFENEIRKIVSTTPSTAQGCQTLMFTATWPESVRDLAATFMKNPVHIHIGENNANGELRANTRIEQQVEVVDPRGKETRMLQIIKKYQSGKSKNDRILVFCLYKKEATRVEGFLRSRGLRVAGIHGDLSQERRMSALEGFKSGECPLLVATDVAARGLDIPAVKLVLNVTFPLTVEDYVHRIGRTGRAGASGLAITLFTEHDKAQSGALINVLKAAGQPVPEDLMKFGTTVKKKGHEAYGAFYKDPGEMKSSTKIRFD
ncbi:MAG: hypothetical protein L6R40_005232 [Gallowayella cf. fulva]|nr:MAG: hypothetical protein L6R40_005232 [Xanthomendoza cf. fulva]